MKSLSLSKMVDGLGLNDVLVIDTATAKVF
jgi:hypothetical protein